MFPITESSTWHGIMFKTIHFYILIGDIYPYPLGKVLTGVAVASARDPFAVYFGCYAEEPGVGGLGLILISASYAGASKQLFSVKSGSENGASTKMYGGALFLMEDYHTECMGQDGYTVVDTAPIYTTEHGRRTTNKEHDGGDNSQQPESSESTQNSSLAVSPQMTMTQVLLYFLPSLVSYICMIPS